MSLEVASTRLPMEILREIDREASTRGISRSVYLAELIEQRALGTSVDGNKQIEAATHTLAGQLREIREDCRLLAQGLRELRAALAKEQPPVSVAGNSPLFERLAFSAFFSEALIKRVSSTLIRNPSELSQVVREARDQAEAEAKLWRNRAQGSHGPERAP